MKKGGISWKGKVAKQIRNVSFHVARIFSKSTPKPFPRFRLRPRHCGGHRGLDYKGPGGKFGGDFSRLGFGVMDGLGG